MHEQTFFQLPSSPELAFFHLRLAPSKLLGKKCILFRHAEQKARTDFSFLEAECTPTSRNGQSIIIY